MQKGVNFTKEESDWLKVNYSLIGPLKCSEYLGRTKRQITRKAYNLKIKHKEFFDYSRFVFDLENPHFIYFLGFCWADGHVSKHGTKYDCCIRIAESDGVTLKNVFLNFADFKISSYKPPVGSISTCFYSRNQELCQFLFENDYMDKSYVEPTKILSKIPENLKHYFWRGFFDGDGCVSNGKSNPNEKFTLSIAARSEYKWTEFIKLIGDKKYSLKVKTTPLSKTSVITIWRQEEIVDFFHYLYPDLKFDIGLMRKYKKFCLCLRHYLKSLQRKFRLINGKVYYNNQKGIPRNKYLLAPRPNLKTLYHIFLEGGIKEKVNFPRASL